MTSDLQCQFKLGAEIHAFLRDRIDELNMFGQ